MPVHFRREIQRLSQQILALSREVETQVWQAVRSVEERDAELARQVIDKDRAIDLQEVEVEEECLKILALYQPVAIDLRYVVAVLKINNDLERIGDLAVNIAERALFLAQHPEFRLPVNLTRMAHKTLEMLRNSLESLLNLDSSLARSVCQMDNEVDSLHLDIYRMVEKKLCEQCDCVRCYISLLSVSKHLERIADLATNIAEDVIYMIEGKIIRHHREEGTSDHEPQPV